ncbi:MAG: hypothetical protein GVY16_00175 [Planctomycetes bacterium]|nr:hypothetical protein [Planctomycetota bacterium]
MSSIAAAANRRSLSKGVTVIRNVASMLVVLAAATAAMGNDRLWLNDGRDLRGHVQLSGNHVILLHRNGQSSFPLQQVKRVASRQQALSLIAPQSLPGQETRAAHDWYLIGRRMEKLQLRAQARNAYKEALKRNPLHGAANRAVGHVHVRGHWKPFHTALAEARRLLRDGQADLVLREVVPAVQRHAENTALLDLLEVKAQAQMQLLRFDEAAVTYRGLAGRAGEPRRTRYAAMANLLEEHPDGVIVLDAPWPPQAALLGPDQADLPAGPVSLAVPHAVQAAMHHEARRRLAQAAQCHDQAAAFLAGDTPLPDQAEQQLTQAASLLDQADALHARIAEPQRDDHRRLTIRIHRVRAERHAQTFDRRMEALQFQQNNANAYVRSIKRLLNDIEVVRQELHMIIRLANRDRRTFRRELALARSDLGTLQRLGSLLLGERRRVQMDTREVANAP